MDKMEKEQRFLSELMKQLAASKKKWGHIATVSPQRTTTPNFKADAKPAFVSESCPQRVCNPSNSKYMREGRIEGKDVKMLVDTAGSYTSIVKADLVENEKLKEGEAINVVCVHGDSVDYSTAEVDLEMGGWIKKTKVALVPGVPVDVLIGIKDFDLSEEIPSQSNCAHNLAVMTRSQTRKEVENQRKVKAAEKVRLADKKEAKSDFTEQIRELGNIQDEIKKPEEEEPKTKTTTSDSINPENAGLETIQRWQSEDPTLERGRALPREPKQQEETRSETIFFNRQGLLYHPEVPQESAGFSPFELLYGRRVRGPLDVLKEARVGYEREHDNQEGHSAESCEEDNLEEFLLHTEESSGDEDRIKVDINAKLNAQQRFALEELLHGFRDLFGNKLGRTQAFKHSIEFGDATLIRQAPYRIPLSQKQMVKDELDKMIEMDTLDLARGYWQIPMSEASIEKTAFATPFALCEFVLMPFGLHSAPATFMRMMNHLLSGYQSFVDPYFEDIPVFSEGYYRRFILNYSNIAAPLSALTQKAKPVTLTVQWNQETQTAFEKLKNTLTSDPVLKAPEVEKSFIVQTEACDLRIGAVLSQLDEDGKERPVAYASRKLYHVRQDSQQSRKSVLFLFEL
ncbi:Retrovirus-related Pol polyprotein from transposon 17.6 [Stylophora pistillata]|uniref:Retrovirus-related Pol polyprotein from transposon 17.6 n=1 Tax=Stylophora pistillata TaxID=50429 RepID=A0A2B4R6D8_STYPI|nr:Retrovirus-related Pol polyprotein from transposon 17.6 [Stylophora pistillata]